MAGRTVTIKEIAKEAQVSVATVSRYLNGSGYVDDDTGARIAEVVKKLDYHPNRMAQGLKSKATKNVALIVPDIQNPFYSTMAVTAQQSMMQQGYTVTLFNTYGEERMELESIRTVEKIGADGIIFAGVVLQDEIGEAMKRSGIPAVVANVSEMADFDTVEGDAGTSTYMTTRYLLEMGHTKIGFAGAAIGNASSKNRRNGYVKALREAGIEIRKEYIFEMGQILNSEAGLKGGYYFSALEDSPTAICCSNDLLALGIYQAFHQLKIRIPEEVSVTGVDDIMYAALCNPGLTTVTNDSRSYADVAVKALLERMQGKYTGAPRDYHVESTLIMRDSVSRRKA